MLDILLFLFVLVIRKNLHDVWMWLGMFPWRAATFTAAREEQYQKKKVLELASRSYKFILAVFIFSKIATINYILWESRFGCELCRNHTQDDLCLVCSHEPTQDNISWIGDSDLLLILANLQWKNIRFARWN